MSLVQSFNELIETVSKTDAPTIKDKKIRIINGLSTLISQATLIRTLPFQELSDLFEAIRKSAILNIHENPVIDTILFIKHTNSLQKALEIVRLNAFDVFAAEQHTLRTKNEYPMIFENIEKAWKYPVFAMPRANWNKHFLWTEATHAQIRLVGLYDEMKEDERSYRKKNNLPIDGMQMDTFQKMKR